MRVAGYASPLVAYSKPTGVGQHILGMFGALSGRQDVQFKLMSPQGTLGEAAKFMGSNAASSILPIPLPDRPLRFGTSITSMLSVDRWLEDAEWVYAPVEQPVTTKRRMAVTVHDVSAFESGDPNGYGRRASLSWRRRMKRLIADAALIATVSQFTRSRLLALFDVPDPTRVCVVGNGGAEGFSPIPSPADQSVLRLHGLRQGHYVVFPASLTRRKSGDLLLKVAELAGRRNVDLSFAVIGRLHETEILNALEVMRRDNPNLPVTLLGYVTRDQLASLYRNALATMMISRYEGFGIPVVEALASGCPVFISSQPALMEAAAGAATIVETEPEGILSALLETNGQRPLNGDVVEMIASRTWRACADRLIEAMRTCSAKACA